jgi:hypothetical protein
MSTSIECSICVRFAPGGRSIHGTKFDVLLGLRALECAIFFTQLVKKIGAVAFSKFAKCGLGDLEKYAPGVEASVVTGANTGSRPLKVFARAA